MSKNYTDFMDELSSEDLYEGLLAYGLFAEKLPPVFTSVPFFKYCKTNNPSVKGGKEYTTFTVMRNVSIPRLMGIPNPFKYQMLCSELRDDWKKIREHFHKQTDGHSYCVSRIHIRKEYGDNKRIFAMNYKNWHADGNPELDLLIHDKGTSRVLVHADISSCFPSIYTHSIPWALVGKEESKKNRDSTIWYNKIDKACSDMRYGETHGILIGPHASNLISEIILTVVDKKLYDKDYRFIRNIDDYDCYVNCYDDAQCFLRDLEEALREFDLPLNHNKTKIIELPIGIEKNWKHQLSDLPKTNKFGIVGYPQVNAFIDTALKLATESGDFAIINYAIKKLNGTNLSENGKKLAAKRFMHESSIKAPNSTHPHPTHDLQNFQTRTDF